MRYRSRCRTRTVQRCHTEGDPPATPGPIAPTLTDGSHVHALPWPGCSALAGMLCAVSMLGCPTCVLPVQQPVGTTAAPEGTRQLGAVTRCASGNPG